LEDKLKMFETNKKTFPFCVSCKNTASNAWKWLGYKQSCNGLLYVYKTNKHVDLWPTPIQVVVWITAPTIR